MNRIEIDTNTDDTASIRIRLPAAVALRPVHVVVEWEDAPRAPTPEWVAEWVKSTSGAITDPTFVRQPQGEYEERDELP